MCILYFSKTGQNCNYSLVLSKSITMTHIELTMWQALFWILLFLLTQLTPITTEWEKYCNYLQFTDEKASIEGTLAV